MLARYNNKMDLLPHFLRLLYDRRRKCHRSPRLPREMARVPSSTAAANAPSQSD
jgi:hypothetical protein